MEETLATRLKLFIDTNGMTTSQFADMCGIPRPSLSQILTGRNKKVSDIIIGQIHKTFPDLSVMWLLFGEGPVKTAITNPIERAVSNSGRGVSGDSSMSENSVEGQFSGSDMEKFMAGNAVGNKYSKENGLTGAQKGFNDAKNQQFETEIKINDLHRQIENLRKNPRRVVQITIYYDDSTFETFIPKG